MPSLYTDEEDRLIHATWASGYMAYITAGGNRSYDSYQKRKKRLAEASRSPYQSLADPALQHDKFLGDFNWRKATRVLREMQDLKARASTTQQYANIIIEADRPVAVMTLGDTHLGSWSTDYDLFMRLTDEILSIPELRIILLGDMAHMAIKLRSVEEVSDNLLPPDLQLRYLESWLEEMQPRILFGVWGNHEVEREEAQAGGSRFADLYKRMAVYFGGIGHADVQVGSHTYRIAASHKFQGRSMVDPTYGPKRYLLQEGIDRDIAVAGDSHVPGMLKFNHGGNPRLALNCGSIQTMSGYSRRYFSLKTAPIFPVFTLDPEEKRFLPYWSLSEYLAR